VLPRLELDLRDLLLGRDGTGSKGGMSEDGEGKEMLWSSKNS